MREVRPRGVGWAKPDNQVTDDRERSLEAREHQLERAESALRQRERFADERERLADERERLIGIWDESLALDPVARRAIVDEFWAAREQRAASASLPTQVAEERSPKVRGLLQRSHGLLDELTQVLRRGAGLEILQRELARATRLDAPFTLALTDVDQLKVVNDRYGHLAGDAVLRGVAAVLSHHLREYDIVSRFGGDEFVVTFNAGIDTALRRLESVNCVLAGGIDAAGTMVLVGVSFGLAERKGGDTPESMLKRADYDLIDRRLSTGNGD